MKQATQFYIDGQWVEPISQHQIDVINPATEQAIGKISMAGPDDVNRAVAAAQKAFPGYAATSRDDRVALMETLIAVYQQRYGEMAEAISDEMGAPIGMANKAQAAMGIGHLSTALEILKNYEFEEVLGTTHVFKEPAGVCGFITPWNWPINQIMCKAAPALAVGCTMVLKPSQVAPLDAYLLAEMIDAAGYPPGVFNLINGAGTLVGELLASHPDIDLVSLTGSTRAGAQVAKLAAESIKRVSLELGGKSANIILDDADFERAVASGVMSCFNNTGQSCNAPTRMLVPANKHDLVVEIAKTTADRVKVGDPRAEDTVIGPQANKKQFESVQRLIQQAIDEGCELVYGGPGKPDDLDVGYYSKPTIFANVRNDSIIGREEAFGPVLAIIPYTDEEEAIAIANDSLYGLSGYVSSGDLERARRVAARMRTGMVHLNGAPVDLKAPFGGYKQSGYGREWGAHGFDEFLEIKAIMGFEARKK